MLVLVVQAWATSSGDAAAPCPPARAIPVLPDVGDVDVPPDVRPVVVLEGCGSTSGFQLVDADEVPVPATLEAISPSAHRIVPDAPLLPGDYSVVDQSYYSYGTDAVWFTVGDGVEPWPTPAEPDFTADFEHRCEDFTILEAHTSLVFPDADRAQRGLLVLEASVDGLRQVGPAPIAYTGQPLEELAVSLPGGRELCVWARLEDLAGAVVWETEELCGPPPDCPSELDDGDGSGACGCDGASGGAIGGLGLAALALLLRRRPIA